MRPSGGGFAIHLLGQVALPLAAVVFDTYLKVGRHSRVLPGRLTREVLGRVSNKDWNRLATSEIFRREVSLSTGLGTGTPVCPIPSWGLFGKRSAFQAKAWLKNCSRLRDVRTQCDCQSGVVLPPACWRRVGRTSPSGSEVWGRVGSAGCCSWPGPWLSEC